MLWSYLAGALIRSVAPWTFHLNFFKFTKLFEDVCSAVFVNNHMHDQATQPKIETNKMLIHARLFCLAPD